MFVCPRTKSATLLAGMYAWPQCASCCAGLMGGCWDQRSRPHGTNYAALPMRQWQRTRMHPTPHPPYMHGRRPAAAHQLPHPSL